jgi:hypothetical protein
VTLLILSLVDIGFPAKVNSLFSYRAWRSAK